MPEAISVFCFLIMLVVIIFVVGSIAKSYGVDGGELVASAWLGFVVLGTVASIALLIA